LTFLPSGCSAVSGPSNGLRAFLPSPRINWSAEENCAPSFFFNGDRSSEVPPGLGGEWLKSEGGLSFFSTGPDLHSLSRFFEGLANLLLGTQVIPERNAFSNPFAFLEFFPGLFPHPPFYGKVGHSILRLLSLSI